MVDNMLGGKVMVRLASVVSLLRGFNWRAPALANNPHLSAGEPCDIYTFPNCSTTFPFSSSYFAPWMTIVAQSEVIWSLLQRGGRWQV